MFRHVLHMLADLHQVNEADCVLIGRQFAAFMDQVFTPYNSAFKEFFPDNDRLDTFLSIRMKGSDHFRKLWPVTKKLASVASQQVAYDAIATAGGLCDVPITKSMQLYAQWVRQRYMAYLEAEKQKQTSTQTATPSKN
ncbi:hypothetical protein LSAT2_009207 [Lamellibrachia satsuma]|nr:hypothetical protein LSAT2_009207 [Lamellibrachia satsuma]